MLDGNRTSLCIVETSFDTRSAESENYEDSKIYFAEKHYVVDYYYYEMISVT